MNEPVINVGILAAAELSFTLEGDFRVGNETYTGTFKALLTGEGIQVGNLRAAEWLFEPVDSESYFEVHEVVIGVDFHWERAETQIFRGALKLIVEENRIRLINRIAAEEYLRSVISSEMSATASVELLKAHAILSRSWLLKPLVQTEGYATPELVSSSADRIIRWYERDAHLHFDVCADDHCQRYQGISRATTRNVNMAVEQTRGQVLMEGERVCDARYYKACGGVTERFDTCWSDENPVYLQPVRDTAGETEFPDLSSSEKAREWILSSPEAFCNTTDKKILSQVLNNYDQETTDFYRWSCSYTQQQLAELIHRKSGIDFGDILRLKALKRGPSGRIAELQITGSKRTVVVGKELEIRKWLSESHLYSSAFVVDTFPEGAEVPETFLLRGAGWGHGVGLCQIGAAVMGERGYGYQDILNHYFKHATIRKIY